MVQIRLMALLLGILWGLTAWATPKSNYQNVENYQTFSQAQLATSLQIPDGTLTLLLQKAADHWGLDFEEAETAYTNGTMVITQIDSKTYRIDYNGSWIVVTQDDL